MRKIFIIILLWAGSVSAQFGVHPSADSANGFPIPSQPGYNVYFEDDSTMKYSTGNVLLRYLTELDVLASGGIQVIKENGGQVGGADIDTLNFGFGLDLTESPDKQININLDFTELGNLTLFPGVSASYTWIVDLFDGDWSIIFADGEMQLVDAGILLDPNMTVNFETALGVNDGTGIRRSSGDDDLMITNASEDIEFIVTNKNFDFRNDATVVHRLAAGSGNDTYLNSAVAINKNSITAGIELDVSGDAHFSGNITTPGTVDGVDISARDHNSVTLAGSYDYLTITGQVITRNQIDAATDITGILADANVSNNLTLTTISGAIDAGAATSFEIPNGATPTTDAFGEIAGDNNAWAALRGAIQAFDGTANTYLVGVLASDTPLNGQVPTWNTGGTVTWENAGGTDLSGEPFYTASLSANLSNETVLTAGYLIDLAAGVIAFDPTEAANLTFGDGTLSGFTHTMDLVSGDINWQYSANAIQVGANMSFVRSSSGNPILTIQNENDDANPAGIILAKNPATANNNDGIGYVQFVNDNSTGSPAAYAQIQALSSDVTSGSEDGLLYLSAANGGVMQNLVTVSGIANKVIITDLQLGTALLPAFGGTGATSLTDGGVLFGSGTNAITASPVMTNGQLLIGDGSGAPTLATLTEGSGITVSNGPGSITIASTLGTAINSAEITDGTILPVDLAGTPSDEYILTYESTGATFQYQNIASFFTEGEGIDFSGTTNLTLSGEDASTSNKGIASFNSNHFSVASGAVSWNTNATITSSTTLLPRVTFENQNSDDLAAQLKYYKNSSSPADGDGIADLYFSANDSSGTLNDYVIISFMQDDRTTNDQAGRFELKSFIGSNIPKIFFTIDGRHDATGRGRIEFNESDEDVDFIVNDTNGQRFTIYGDDGNIGIGTIADPKALLHLKDGGTHLVLETTTASPVSGTDLGKISSYHPTPNAEGASIIFEGDDTWSEAPNYSTRITFWTTNQDNPPAEVFRIAYDGDVTGTHGTYHLPSDIRDKKNIKTLDNALDLIMKLRGVGFNRIKTGKYETGLIAQEVMEVIPSAVHYSEETDRYSVETHELVGVLVQAINQQQKIIESLQAPKSSKTVLVVILLGLFALAAIVLFKTL